MTGAEGVSVRIEKRATFLLSTLPSQLSLRAEGSKGRGEKRRGAKADQAATDGATSSRDIRISRVSGQVKRQAGGIMSFYILPILFPSRRCRPGWTRERKRKEGKSWLAEYCVKKTGERNTPGRGRFLSLNQSVSRGESGCKPPISKKDKEKRRGEGGGHVPYRSPCRSPRQRDCRSSSKGL